MPASFQHDPGHREHDLERRTGSWTPVIRALGDQDCQVTAGMHHQHLSVGLFPQLGTGFLRRWHHTFVAVPHGHGVVAVDDRGHVVGFVLVATCAEEYVEEVLSTQRWQLGAAGVWALLRRPSVAAAFARTRGRRYARRLVRRRPAGPGGHATTSTAAVTARDEEPDVPARTAVVYAMVTAPAVRGRGVGRRMLEDAVEAARSAGAGEVCLLTRDTASSTRAGPAAGAGAAGFYDRLGWQRVRQVARDGAVLTEFRRALS
jgi:GNAT superfamily N-acetyltransferase